MNEHTKLETDQVAPTMPDVLPYEKKKKTPRPVTRAMFWRLAIGAIVLAIVAGFGAGIAAVYTMQASTPGDTLVNDMIKPGGDVRLTEDEERIAAVAEKVSPSVVSIVTSSGRGHVAEGAGTGVIVSKDGYIMTNHHVIDGASQADVVLSNGTRYTDVKIIGSDPLNDIAFIKINDVSDLTPATIGSSGQLRIGQRVVAIGNALGQFQNTVTSGVVSAMGRPLIASSSDGRSQEQLTDLIQTDAAINSGNSGGPLVNLAGQVIGINTAVATDANGIGFAIPINATLGVLKSVLATGKVSRAFLGVQYRDITPDVQAEEELSVSRGALIGENITADSPAAKIGLHTGDIITKVNEYVIGKNGSMSSIIGQFQAGDTVTLTMLRDGKERTEKVQLDAYAGSRR